MSIPIPYYARRYSIKLILVLAAFAFFLPKVAMGKVPSLTPISDNNQYQTGMEEVFLSFRYRGVGDVIVIALYKDDQIYLPVSELFSLLYINHAVAITDNRLQIKGFYLHENNRYEIDFTTGVIRLGNQQRQLKINEQLIGELDFYMMPHVFEDNFDLRFTIDINNLVLRLDTDKRMPVVARMERQTSRQGIRQQILEPDYPLLFNRQRQIIGGAFLDYSLSGNLSENMNIYNYNITGGAEIFRGDVQGTVFGTMAGNRHFYRTGNVRWRYVVDDRPWVTRIKIGQLNSQGLVQQSYRGLHISNDPIQPRRLYDEYRVQGLTVPQSEIEIYLNNRLVEYTIADELGNYDYSVPLTYGSSRLRMVMYNPDGRISEMDRRIQIPFTFLPPGELNYSINAGLMDNPVVPAMDSYLMAHSSASYGFTNWLTGRAGIEHRDGANMERPLVYSSLSARIATQYLVNVDVAPDAFYRMRTSIIYPSSVSWGAGLTHYTTLGGVYNRSGNSQDMDANLYVPFRIKDYPIGVRFSGTHRILYSGSTSTQLRTDLNTRIQRVNLRFGYREILSIRKGSNLHTDGSLSSTATYSIPRRSTLPDLFSGMYLRSRVDYRLSMSRMERFEIHVSKPVWQEGRFQISYQRNFIGRFNTLEAGFIYDFSNTRSSTTTRYSRGEGSIRSNIRGSVGYDKYHNQLLFSNRQQVGRSAASVRLFIDHNNSGSFDEGDEIIPDNAIRLTRAGTRSMDANGITRLSQLQAYHRHNIEINQSAIKNPYLVPTITEFSFIADPNSYKSIDIPFYITGIIEGDVSLLKGDVESPLGGIRVNLKQIDGSFETVMRTFSDGGFYAMEIPPGKYEARIDKSQIIFLNAKSVPEVHEFEVVSISGGDYIDNLHFRVIEIKTHDNE